MIALRILQEPKLVIAWLAREDLSKASCGVFTHGGTKWWWGRGRRRKAPDISSSGENTL